MNQSVSHTAPSRKPSRNPLDYSHRELRLMLVASNALLGGHRPGLSASELAEAERLLAGLDLSADPERFPYPTPGEQDPEDDEHDEGCECHQCDPEPVLRCDDDDDERLDMRRELLAERRCA